MLNTLATSRMLKHANKAKISYGNLKVATPEQFCNVNNITIEQLQTMAPDYKELDLLIPEQLNNCPRCNLEQTKSQHCQEWHDGTCITMRPTELV